MNLKADAGSERAACRRAACRRAARSPLVVMLAAVLFRNYVDRGTLSTAAHLMQPDLGLDDSQMGILLSAFFWSYCFTQIPMGWLAERIGGHRVLAGALTVWALATMLLGVAHSFFMLLSLRVLLGVGESAGFPCVAKIMAASVPPEGLGFANGIVGFAYLMGPAVGTYAGGWLMVHFGWRAAFVVFGALSLLWLLPWSTQAKQVQAGHASAAAQDGPSFSMILKNFAVRDGGDHPAHGSIHECAVGRGGGDGRGGGGVDVDAAQARGDALGAGRGRLTSWGWVAR